MALPFEVKGALYQQVTPRGAFSCPSQQLVAPPLHTIGQLALGTFSSPVPPHLYNHVGALCIGVPGVG